MSKPERLLDPLDEFYSELGLALPKARAIEGEHVPAPYKALLVHDSDMTPTLEAAFKRRIFLRLLKRKISRDLLLRQVTLVLEGSGRAVEFGAIRIHLDCLPSPARPLILEGKLPLGRVLQDFKVSHRSEPAAFFAVEADLTIAEALNISEPQQLLYGRRNSLLLPSGESLAEVIEILPANCIPEN